MSNITYKYPNSKLFIDILHISKETFNKNDETITRDEYEKYLEWTRGWNKLPVNIRKVLLTMDIG